MMIVRISTKVLLMVVVVVVSMIIVTAFVVSAFLPTIALTTTTSTSKASTTAPNTMQSTQPCRRRYLENSWRRFATDTIFDVSSSSPTELATTTTVLYQKVVRSPPKTDPSLLLGLLLEYLQDDFVLPDRLPMTYSVVTTNDVLPVSVSGKELSSPSAHVGSEPVLLWNSPISPNPALTALHVNVIAIYSKSNEDEYSSSGTVGNATTSTTTSTSTTATPDMAMVVVEKMIVPSQQQQQGSHPTSGTSSRSSMPPMLVNLFRASEKQILRALDRGLDEFMMQPSFKSSTGRRTVTNRPKPTTGDDCYEYDETLSPQENALLAAQIVHPNDDDVATISSTTTTTKTVATINSSDAESSNNNNNDSSSSTSTSTNTNHIILDANVIQRNGVNVAGTNDGEPKMASTTLLEQHDNSTTTTTTTTTTVEASPASSPIPMGLDFAVQAAKVAQARRRQLQQEQEKAKIIISQPDDYAVQQAKQLVAQRRLRQHQQQQGNKQNNTDITNISKQSKEMIPIDDPDPIKLQSALMQQRSPMLDDSVPRKSGGRQRRRAFMTTISSPNDYASVQNNPPKKVVTKTPVNRDVQKRNGVSNRTTTRHDKANEANSNNTNSRTVVHEDEEDPHVSQSFSKAINLNVRNNEKEPFTVEEIPNNPNTGNVTDQNGSSDEIYHLSQQALDEMIERNSEEMTPEEMLATVMKYGSEQEMKEQVGAGFVSAAFDKAKSLLREQRERHDVRLQQQAQQVETKNDGRNDESSSVENLPTTEVLSPSEELRRMFLEGERIADSRITTTAATSSSSTIPGVRRTTTEQEIDELIESEKTVTRHARVLDEELTELMIRINKSPTERSDGVGRYPLFDVLSGPEVYDKNVDPLSAVNWPGALPGTKTVRLPKELDEAVRQAKFAAGVLTSVQEVESEDGSKSYKIGKRELTTQQMLNLQGVVKEAVEIGLIDDPLLLQEEEARLQMLLDELTHQPDERMREVTSNYKDLLLSDNFISLISKRLNEMAERDLDAMRRDDDSLHNVHSREREILGQLVVYAQLLLKEVQALGAELESQQIEVIRSICKVAMDPRHRTEEETAIALSDAVRDMRPLFDDGFIAYLKYAVAEEEGRLARAGLLHDPEYNQWLYVLKIVQQGVHAEIAKGVNRYLEHIWHILRMETPIERRMLLEKLVDAMPTLDVRPFVQVVENIVGALGDSVRGEFDGGTALGEMTNKLLQLHRDLKEVLPSDRITKKSRDADEWAAKQKQRLLEQRNLTKQRLKAAQDTEHLDHEIEAFGSRGEVERFV